MKYEKVAGLIESCVAPGEAEGWDSLELLHAPSTVVASRVVAASVVSVLFLDKALTSFCFLHY
ncbi:hypothetical protein D3C75_648770 [compost metagenome]